MTVEDASELVLHYFRVSAYSGICAMHDHLTETSLNMTRHLLLSYIVL